MDAAGVLLPLPTGCAPAASCSDLAWEEEPAGELGSREEGDGQGGGDGSASPQCWSDGSALGGGRGLGPDDASDPTVRLALELGLDPLELPLLGGAGRAGNPAAGKLGSGAAVQHAT